MSSFRLCDWLWKVEGQESQLVAALRMHLWAMCSLKRYGVSCVPSIRKFTVDPSVDEFILVACDGFWGAWSASEAIEKAALLIEKVRLLPLWIFLSLKVHSVRCTIRNCIIYFMSLFILFELPTFLGRAGITYSSAPV